MRMRAFDSLRSLRMTEQGVTKRKRKCPLRCDERRGQGYEA